MSLALYDYQELGAGWLADRRHGYLADAMRLGKSPQAIEGVNLQVSVGRTAIICPAYLRLNWLREVTTWAWYPWTPEILSYEVATRDGLPRADTYIFDEAHYLKNPHAKRTRTLLGFDDSGALDPFHPLRDAAHVWPLSGTPGNPTEAWTWLRAFGAVDMPWIDFAMRYCDLRFNEWGAPTILRLKRDRLAELKALLAPWFLRRTTAEVGLPEARWGLVSLECGVDNPRQEPAAVDEDFIGGRLAVDTPTATLVRELGQRKVGPLVELATRELLSGEVPKLCIVAWHVAVLDELEARLAAFKPLKVDGSVSEARKLARRDAFNTDPEHRVWLGQTKCMVGIDLAAMCSDGLFAELSWNPDDNAQAAARLLGPKQTRPVLWRVAVSEDPLEAALSRVNARKSEIATKTWS